MIIAITGSLCLLSCMSPYDTQEARMRSCKASSWCAVSTIADLHDLPAFDDGAPAGINRCLYVMLVVMDQTPDRLDPD